MERLTENMIRWAESKLGSTAYEEMEASMLQEFMKALDSFEASSSAAKAN